MTLPSSIFGPTTTTVGLFRTDRATLRRWMAERAETRVSISELKSDSSILAEVASVLEPSTATRGLVALVSWGGWTLMLTGGPLGTDLGLFPSRAASRLGVLAIRATASPGPAENEATILEVFDPEVEERLCVRRSIAAARDGRWTFHQYGSPFSFEDVNRYSRGPVRERFGPDQLSAYLEELGAPRDATELLGPGVGDLLDYG